MPEGAQDDFKIPIPPIDISNSEKPKKNIISYIDRIYREDKKQYEDELGKPFFIIPLRFDKYKKNYSQEEKKRRPYTPRTEVAKRSDAGFYQAFYNADTIGIFADYDDVVAQFLARNPNVQLSFEPSTGRVTVNEGGVSPAELNSFIQGVLPYGIPASAFDPEGSARRVEERQWFQALQGVDLASRATTLHDLQRIGLLSRAVPAGVTQREVYDNRLVDTNRQALRKFYRRRQHFWHPDRWNHVDGLTDAQKRGITEMSSKLNRLGGLI